jgi:hypothetical protein
LLEGSACTLRISVEMSSNAAEASPNGNQSSQPGAFPSPPSLQAQPDERFLRVVEDILAILIRLQFFVLFEQPEPAEELQPQTLYRRATDISEALRTYVASTVLMSARDGADVPLSLWAIPAQNELAALATLKGFRSAIDDRWRWRKVIQSGIVAITLYADTCSLAFDCSQADALRNVVRSALDGTNVETRVTWLS